MYGGMSLRILPLRKGVSAEGSGEERGFIFIVPRGDDMLVLGGAGRA
jgi:hypothetical protein